MTEEEQAKAMAEMKAMAENMKGLDISSLIPAEYQGMMEFQRELPDILSRIEGRLSFVSKLLCRIYPTESAALITEMARKGSTAPAPTAKGGKSPSPPTKK